MNKLREMFGVRVTRVISHRAEGTFSGLQIARPQRLRLLPVGVSQELYVPGPAEDNGGFEGEYSDRSDGNLSGSFAARNARFTVTAKTMC